MNLAGIHDLLRRLRGIDPSTLSQVGLRGAVQRRMGALGHDDVSTYAGRLAVDADEFETLIQAVLVHETSFFRYPASFEVLVREALGQLRQDAHGVFRVHCVASSTGEEPASAVMALLGAGIEPERLHIDASDVSERAINYAREGLYRARGVERVPGGLRAQWFRADGEGYRLSPAIRSTIRHRVANALAPDFGMGAAAYDAILCRNLLIYLVPEARRRLLDALVAMLRPGGLLFVGHAEVAAVRTIGLELEEPAEAFVCRHASASSAGGGTRASVPAPRRARAAPPASRPPVRPAPPVLPRGEDVLREATSLADAGRLPEARRVLLDGIAAGPVTADHYHLLALVASAGGADLESEEALRRALYLDPAHHPSLMQLALLVEARGERARAQRLRAKAARVKGGDHDG